MFKKIFILIMLFSIPGDLFCQDFFKNEYWNSGKADFQTFDAQLTKYNIKRNAKVTILIIKEPFNLKKYVKALKYEKAFDVIKMNYIRKIPAGVYEYNQMFSAYFDRNSGQLLKVLISSQDGCGMTFKKYQNNNKKNEMIIHSYFDGEGDTKLNFSENNFVFYETLPMVLRFRLKEKEDYILNITEPLLTNRKDSEKLYKAEVKVKKVNDLKEIKSKEKLYEVVMTYGEKKDYFYFEGKFPHRLLKWTKSNNDTLLIRKSDFLYYWNYTKPEHNNYF